MYACLYVRACLFFLFRVGEAILHQWAHDGFAKFDKKNRRGPKIFSTTLCKVWPGIGLEVGERFERSVSTLYHCHLTTVRLGKGWRNL